MACPVEGGGPEGTNDHEETLPPLTKERIEGHVSALKSLIKSHNQRNKGNPIRLDFESEDTKVQDLGIAKGNELMDEKTSGIPLKNINEWADLREAFAAMYSVRRACSKEPHGITQIVRKANESLTAFKERWTVETGFIMGVPEVMKISSFMDSVKSPELAKRFSNKVPTTANENGKAGRFPKIAVGDGIRVEKIKSLGEGCTAEGQKAEGERDYGVVDEHPDILPRDILEGRFRGTFDCRSRGGRILGQNGRNLEAYVDDMVIKSKDKKMLLADIAKTFDNLKRINMKLNPKKCSFGVEEGKFLGYMVTSGGIRANPKKTKALADLQSSRTLKEMQSLSRKLVALNQAVSVVLLTDRKGRQCHLQYVSRTLNEAENNYASMEKLALSLIHMTRRLRRYFNAHLVKVITDQLIKNILNNTETSINLAKYDVELGAYNITFIPRNAVKGQVLAYFLLEAPKGEKEELYFQMPEVPLEKDDIESWTLFTDRAFSPKGSWAECNALLDELRIARQMNISNIEVKVDSKLVKHELEGRRVKQARVGGIQSFDKGSIGRGSQRAIHRKLRGAHCVRGRRGQLDDPHYMVCMGSVQANYVIREIHMGSCGMIVGPRAVARKAIRQGYYWPTMHEDVKKEIEKCDSYQIHAPVPRLPTTLMMSIMAPWSFYQWGMDILGHTATGKGRFGLPRIIVNENEAHLVNDPNKSWCGKFEIHQVNMAVAHPQANRLVERANRSLIEGIKTHLEREKARWVDELPNVLWAHQTSIKQRNEEIPFSLTDGSEAVIPVEIGIPTYRTLMIREGYNEEEILLNLDLLQEMRETTAVREARYKTKMKQYYNKKVRPSSFRLGEFVF
uniref:Reverse transcriptase domain-containing protein n=1 Tax=Tanacetum cinerariifolium TaxID=118510 RepID=A0A699GNY5_TANCI|nr:reverse transcriptase domain-containing protein [Tanacetum cinerariifolium]